MPLSTQEYNWVPANCWGNLTNCGGVTCDGLASHPGGVEILLAASCYRIWVKLRQLWASQLQGFTFHQWLGSFLMPWFQHRVMGVVIMTHQNLHAGNCFEPPLMTWQATTLVTRVGKKSFYTHFAPPHPCAMLTKHFHPTQICILPFSNFERRNRGSDTYSVGVTIMISCFWHFPTQFVHDCKCWFI